MQQLEIDFERDPHDWDLMSPEEQEICRQAHEEMMEMMFRRIPPEGPIVKETATVIRDSKKVITLENLIKTFKPMTIDDINAELQVASNANHRDRHFD